jgi:hypothetical protein
VVDRKAILIHCPKLVLDISNTSSPIIPSRDYTFTFTLFDYPGDSGTIEFALFSLTEIGLGHS